MSAPSEVTCPNCQAPAGRPCNVPTNNGRRDVPWFHSARENLAASITLESPAEKLARTLLATLEGDPTVTMLACDCGKDLDISSSTTAAEVQALIEHAAFDHTSRRQIDVYRMANLLSGYELGTLLRLAPQTAHEEEWRQNRA